MENIVNSNNTIYSVTEQTLYLGCRIEGFNINTYFFKTKPSALNFAYKLAMRFNLKLQTELKFAENGCYKFQGDDGGYECWPEYTIIFNENIVDNENDLLFKISSSA